MSFNMEKRKGSFGFSYERTQGKIQILVLHAKQHVQVHKNHIWLSRRFTEGLFWLIFGLWAHMLQVWHMDLKARLRYFVA